MSPFLIPARVLYSMSSVVLLGSLFMTRCSLVMNAREMGESFLGSAFVDPLKCLTVRELSYLSG